MGFALAALILGSGRVVADPVDLDVRVAHPWLRAGEKQTTYVRVGLLGHTLTEGAKRAPVNVCLVLDKSGSMAGDKIRQAREGAKLAIQRLRPDDIVSIVTYDSGAEVVVPATKASDRESIFRRLDRIGAGGNTALYAGVSLGATELRKFLSRERVNRIFLLSDGLANVGPSSTSALAELGKRLAGEGMSVTTLGLGEGYNEDLMAQLALRSDGSHSFIAEPAQLTAILDEDFGEALAVVAQDVSITIRCGKGARPVRVLGREADIHGNRITARLGQITAGQHPYVLLEVEVSPENNGCTREIASVEVSYHDLRSDCVNWKSRAVSAQFTDSKDLVERHFDVEVAESCAAQIAVEQNEQATRLRDEGRIAEARELLWQNSGYLEKEADRLGSKMLKRYGLANRQAADNLEDSRWNLQRKQMRYEQVTITQGKDHIRIEPKDPR